MDPLYRGAVATGIAAASGLLTSMPTFDPEHFSPVTLHGALHLAELIAWVIFVAEVRYAKAWADKFTGNGTGNGKGGGSGSGTTTGGIVP